MAESNAYNMDCLAAMREMPDKAFDLAVVDVPYGINVSGSMGKRKRYGEIVKHKKVTWDRQSPSQEYFDELFRVSKNQVIFGANHFISKIPIDSSCWIVWDKQFAEDISFASVELAWTSFTSVSKKVSISPSSENGGHSRIHPTEKPIKLYRWIFQHYAKPGDKILDTHLGSGSSRIAAYDMGLDFWGYEIDKEYFDLEEERFARHAAQINLFIDE